MEYMSYTYAIVCEALCLQISHLHLQAYREQMLCTQTRLQSCVQSRVHLLRVQAHLNCLEAQTLGLPFGQLLQLKSSRVI